MDENIQKCYFICSFIWVPHLVFHPNESTRIEVCVIKVLRKMFGSKDREGNRRMD